MLLYIWGNNGPERRKAKRKRLGEKNYEDKRQSFSDFCLALSYGFFFFFCFFSVFLFLARNVKLKFKDGCFDPFLIYFFLTKPVFIGYFFFLLLFFSARDYISKLESKVLFFLNAKFIYTIVLYFFFVLFVLVQFSFFACSFSSNTFNVLNQVLSNNFTHNV